MTTQAEFFQTHAVDGVLSDEHMAQLIQLPEGDSDVSTPQSGTPEPTAAPVPTPAPTGTPPADPPTPTPEPVILAKDGVHTIGYEKLVEEREGRKAEKQRADTLEQENEALKRAMQSTPAPTAAPVATPAPVDLARFGDFSDEALAKGIEETVKERVDAIVEAKVAERVGPLERRALEDATTKHFTTIYTAHPNLDAMLESKELESWITAQPSYAQPGIRAVIDGGTATQVVELFDSFVKATGKTATPPPEATAKPAVDPTAVAQAAIDNARTAVPTSLSEIPGVAAHHDNAEAMREASPLALMNQFAGKSPEQIEALLAKAL